MRDGHLFADSGRPKFLARFQGFAQNVGVTDLRIFGKSFDDFAKSTRFGGASQKGNESRFIEIRKESFDGHRHECRISWDGKVHWGYLLSMAKDVRASGVLLHPTSLPGPGGIGDLGPEANRFLERIAGAGQS